MIHCGVHGKAKQIYLEQNAFNGNFEDADCLGQKLDCCNVTLRNSGEKCEQLCTKFDLANIINETDATALKLSSHPGKWVKRCDFMRQIHHDIHNISFWFSFFTCRRQLFMRIYLSEIP